ncbi:putative translation initiation factor IF2/IF5 [Helianthus debilis subsp. tardiflorus]
MPILTHYPNLPNPPILPLLVFWNSKINTFSGFRMRRQPEHVMTFLLAELGTSGSLDGQQRLVVKGRFAPKSFQGILRRYMNDYVICNSCKGRDTRIEKDKENRLTFLNCDECGSQRSVAPIKAGFVARVGRRKAEI